MLEIAKTHSIEPFIYTFGKNHQVYYRQTHNDGSLAYLNSLKKNDRVKQILRFEFHKNENVSGFLLIGAKESLEPAYKTLKDKHSNHLNLYFAEDVSMKGYFWLQSFHQQATKGNMIKKLSDRLNFSLQKTVVFGDYLNDLDMFKFAGYSIAVENALPEVKQSANQIIGLNSNGAVLDFLESVWYNV